MMRLSRWMHAAAAGILLSVSVLAWAKPPNIPSKPDDVEGPGTQPDVSGAPEDVYSMKANDKHGIPGITLLSGGRARAQALFQQKLDDVTIKNTFAGSDKFNNVICWVRVEDKSKGNRKLEELSYQEHAKTGLAWIEYRFQKPSGQETRRYIFLERLCPAWKKKDGNYQSQADADDCAKDLNSPARDSLAWFIPGSKPENSEARCPDLRTMTTGGAAQRLEWSTNPLNGGDGGGGEM